MKPSKKNPRIVSVSGGPDSVYLARKAAEGDRALILAHFNHRARGKASSADRKFVERLAETLGAALEIREAPPGGEAGNPSIRKAKTRLPPKFEDRARAARYAFLDELKKARGAETILLGHNADDQVETVLMRILEGAGITGLKGIPRKTDDGILRPLLDTWKKDILAYLHEHKIPYRVDRSNFDTRFERNWIRHVLIPLLEKRYGSSVKKRIFALGERFREIDEFLDDTAARWVKRNVRIGRKGGLARSTEIGGIRVSFPRKPYSRLPGAVRKKILQRICFERLGIAPNERLLGSMDRLAVSGGPSSMLHIGKGAILQSGYENGIFLAAAKPPGRNSTKAQPGIRIRMNGPGRYEIPFHSHGKGPETGSPVSMAWEEKGGFAPAALKRLAKGERAAAFDAGDLSSALTVRPLRQGDRIRPFGMSAEKKVKEILIDRKLPRDERWGRPVVCDAEGKILWIPGVLRSGHGPVTPGTRRTIILRVLPRAVKPA